MLTLALTLALAQYPQHRLFLQPNLPAGQAFAFFEAFPASGAGTTTACSTTAPTGARGEALTFTRTGNATCTKTATGGLATSGIADGDLVVLSGNQPRVEYDSNGVLGLLVESARTNVFLQSGDIANAVNTDVATPTLTGSQTDPFGTSTAVQMDDNNAAAYEGRTQTVTVSAGAAYIMSCFVKGGTSTLARLSLDGTACNVSGLSTTTWTRATCADASSSGVAIAAQVLVGNATTDTGTIIVGGCQVEAGAYATSYIPTGAGTAARNAETASFTLASSVGPTMCLAASVQWPSADVGAVNFASFGIAGTNFTLYRTNNTSAGYQINATTTAPAVSAIGTTTHRSLLYDNAGTRAAFWDGTSVSAPAATMGSAQTVVWVGHGISGAVPANGIVSRFQLDPSALRCNAL